MGDKDKDTDMRLCVQPPPEGAVSTVFKSMEPLNSSASRARFQSFTHLLMQLSMVYVTLWARGDCHSQQLHEVSQLYGSSC